jgi:hypothetical protein
MTHQVGDPAPIRLLGADWEVIAPAGGLISFQRRGFVAD